MALIECHECKREISDQAKVCPGCGAKVRGEPKSYAWLWTILILLAGFVWYSTVTTKEQRQDQMAYELCMQTLKHNPGNAVAAGACAMLREKFKAKYHREP
jgi:hypothetical protein